MPRAKGIQRGSREPDQVERDARAVELRRRHLTYQQIADEMGWASKSAAYGAVRRGLADSVRETNDEVRQQELDRLDDLARRALVVMTTKHYKVNGKEVVRHPQTREPLIDDAPVLRAVETFLKVMERRARLLGIDAPQQVEVITMGSIESEIARLAAEIRLRESEPVE